MNNMNCISKVLFGLLIAVVAAGGLANAQVATNNLSAYATRIFAPNNPGLSGTEITPDNPPAVGFIEVSMVALGTFSGEYFDNLTSTSSVNASIW